MTGTWAGQPERALHFYYPQWEHVDDEAANSYWATRGWTFQERLLSTRILYFGRNGIRFECRGAVFQEVNLRSSAQHGLRAFFASPNHQSSEWDDMQKVRLQWYTMVSEYIERQLSKESDRLIALSGVAQKFGIYFGANDEYLLGFWKDDICHGLCWRAWRGMLGGKQSARPLTKSPSFPSWSWCSMQRPLLWSDGTGSPQCADLVETVKSSGVKSEYTKLLFDAWVFPATLLEFKFPKGLEMHIHLDAEEEESGDFTANGEQMAVVMTADLADGCNEKQWRTSPAKVPHEVFGLVVENAGSFHQGFPEYRRMGAFNVMRDLQMEVDSIEIDEGAATPFFEQMYASLCTIALV